MKANGNRKDRIPRPRTPRIVARFVAISWRDLAVSFGPILLICAAAIWFAIRLIQPAPPSTLTLSAGPPGSSYWNTAQRYKAILARNGIKLVVLPSQGSLQNLERLTDPAAQVDVAFVQSGALSAVPNAAASDAGPASAVSPSADAAAAPGPNVAAHLVSLGSVAYVPLVVFYRGPVRTRLSEFAGERLAIGPEGSGARALALALLKANEIEPGGKTALLPLTGDAAARALTDGQIDVAFLAGESAQLPVMARLVRTPGVRLLSFSQAQAYVRRFTYLNDIELPMGAVDLGKNLPPQTVHTLAPTADLIARDALHPALSDLLIEAAREVNGRASLLQRAGEFPAPLVHDFPISDDAARYYKSGKGFLYRVLPFWMASLADRFLVLIVPIVVVLIPGVKLVPPLYTWRVKSRIYRWYGVLIGIERAALSDTPEAERLALVAKLDAIEDAVNRMKMPLAYADQFYVLREHIGFVRERLSAARERAPESGSAAPG
jgi:hypothetical protein